MPNDRVPKHKQRLATDSKGEQDIPTPSTRPAPTHTDSTPAGTVENESVSKPGNKADEKKEK